MEIKAGDIIHAYCNFVPGNKFLICVCPSSSPLFLLINSEPRRKTPDAQIKITPKDFPFLDHDSFINTATICAVFPDELKKAVPMGSLPDHIREEVLRVIDGSKHLSPNQQDLIKKNLGNP